MIAQLDSSFKRTAEKNMQYCFQKAAEDCMFVCDGIAPNDGKRLFEAMKSADLARPDAIVDDLVIVKPQMNAYKKATNRSTKTQILSLQAYKYFVSTLKSFHSPYGKLFTGQRPVKEPGTW